MAKEHEVQSVIIREQITAALANYSHEKFDSAREINLKTAKALGLTVPPSLLALANEVIE